MWFIFLKIADFVKKDFEAIEARRIFKMLFHNANESCEALD